MVDSSSWVSAGAAVVQAVGALGAIYASFRFAREDSVRARAELREQRERDSAAIDREVHRQRSRLEAIRAAALIMLKSAVRSAQMADDLLGGCEVSRQAELARMCSTDFDALGQHLRSFPLQDLEDPKLVEIFASGTAAAAVAWSFYDHVDAGSRPTSTSLRSAGMVPSTASTKDQIRLFTVIAEAFETRLGML